MRGGERSKRDVGMGREKKGKMRKIRKMFEKLEKERKVEK